MINISGYQIFSDNTTTLKETSVDDHDSGRPEYMTESDMQAVDYDKVKDAYVSGMALGTVPGSCDALLENSSHNIVFVEFKNGSVGKKTRYAVQKKIYDTLLIFNDIVSIELSELRKCAEFILVYNEAKNSTATSESDDDGVEIAPAPSMETIVKTVSGYAKKEIVRFGFGQFEKYCFKKVHTYTKEEFEDYLKHM